MDLKYLDFQRLPPAGTWKYLGGGLFFKFFLTQSIRNCLGDLPVHCCLVYSKLRLSTLVFSIKMYTNHSWMKAITNVPNVPLTFNLHLFVNNLIVRLHKNVLYNVMNLTRFTSFKIILQTQILHLAHDLYIHTLSTMALFTIFVNK